MNLFKYISNIDIRNKICPFKKRNDVPPKDKIFWNITIVSLLYYLFITQKDKYDDYLENLDERMPIPPPTPPP